MEIDKGLFMIRQVEEGETKGGIPEDTDIYRTYGVAKDRRIELKDLSEK